jgi:hypothetical protein
MDSQVTLFRDASQIKFYSVSPLDELFKVHQALLPVTEKDHLFVEIRTVGIDEYEEYVITALFRGQVYEFPHTNKLEDAVQLVKSWWTTA